MIEPGDDLTIRPPRKAVSGWIGVGLFTLLYITLYAGNFFLPLNGGSYTTRIWSLSPAAFTFVALITLIQRRHLLTPSTTLLGLSLAALSTLSHLLNSPNLWGSLLKGIAVWSCFQAGKTK